MPGKHDHGAVQHNHRADEQRQPGKKDLKIILPVWIMRKSTQSLEKMTESSGSRLAQMADLRAETLKR